VIPIDPQRIAEKIDQAWHTAAAQYAHDIAMMNAAERREYLRKTDHWALIKNALKAAAFDKCWYCEALDQRADGAVDHFRPKGRVHECKHHPGYWWLAFDVANYRFCCTYCNSGRSRVDVESNTISKGGKQDQFPLIDESRRVSDPNIGSINNEAPVLLDPLNPLDCALLTFDLDGKAHASVDKCEAPIEYDRVERTIAIYHLNDPVLVKARKKLIWEVSEHLKNANEAHQDVLQGNARSKASRTTDLQRIHAKMSAPSPYSKAAKVAVFNKYGSSELARALLQS
jgi:uncharacterized protein (TIGR02646 family)